MEQRCITTTMRRFFLQSGCIRNEWIKWSDWWTGFDSKEDHELIYITGTIDYNCFAYALGKNTWMYVGSAPNAVSDMML